MSKRGGGAAGGGGGGKLKFRAFINFELHDTAKNYLDILKRTGN